MKRNHPIGNRRRAALITALLWAAVALWAALIFFLGSQNAEESSNLSGWVADILRKLLPFVKSQERFHHFVRKMAHFCAFLALAVLAVCASRRTFSSRRRAYIGVLAACLLLAAGNEFEQNFADGRGPSAWDVAIDFSGAVLGTALVCAGATIVGRIRMKKQGMTSSADEARVFDSRAKWLCAAEFCGLEPANVFHREAEKMTPDERNRDLGNYHMYARRTFRMGTRAESARLRITADDYYKLYINGEFVAQGPAPGYPDHYYANEIDVLPYLRSGDNVIALDVYYQGLINRVWVSGDLRQGFICDLRVDGRTLLVSDERFRYVRSTSYENGKTFGYDTQWAENFDSREEPEGWKSLGFDDFLWTACAAKPKTDYRFALQQTPVLQTRVVAPVDVKREGNALVCDFGREIAGVLLLTADGDAGKRVTLHFGEELNEDGSVRWKTRCNCDYEEVWTLAGRNSRLEMYDYRAFRYAEILLEDGVTLGNIAAREQHYPLCEDACTLETDDSALMDVFALCKSTIRTGVQENYIDCPTREKGQYSGDLAVTSLTHLYLSGDTRLLRKALDDWMRSSFIADGLMAVFPSALMQEIADYSLLFPMVALRYCEHTLDTAFLRSAYEAGRRVLKTYEKYAREDGLLRRVTEAWNLVDWPKNLRDGYDFPVDVPVGEGTHNVINAFYVGAVGDMEKMAAILGEPVEKRFEALKRSYHKAFFREETGLYADSDVSSHSAAHSNILPLFFGIVPKENEARVAEWLSDGGIKTGVYMAFFLLKALARAGRYDDAYRLMVSEGEHSWRNMLSEGATTLFEAWGKDQKWNTSLCHPWASAPVSVLVEDILGITPEVARGGTWKPRLPETVRSLRMTVPVADKNLTVVRENGATTLTIEKRENK